MMAVNLKWRGKGTGSEEGPPCCQQLHCLLPTVTYHGQQSATALYCQYLACNPNNECSAVAYGCHATSSSYATSYRTQLQHTVGHTQPPVMLLVGQ